MDNNLVQQGKALVLTIQGLQALDTTNVKISVIETNLRPQLIKAYRRKLKAIIKKVPPDDTAELLMAMQGMLPPKNDPNLN